MKLPKKFEAIISKNQNYYSIVLDIITSFEPIFKDNKLYFFEEYTDHGINHIEKVLESAEFIITDESFEKITSNEILILILSIILHDIGMHIELSTFNSMLKGDYDSTRIEILDDKTWNELWNDYLNEVKRFSSIQKRNIFGDENVHFKLPDLTNKDNLTGHDKKLIGEFIRRHHGRFAHEIAIIGLKGENGFLSFGTEKLDIKNRELAGILARSHSMNVRDTFSYLEDIAHESWRNPQGINIVYLMVVLRISDYIQIDSSRVNPYLLKLKSFNSPISQLEHNKHLEVVSLNFNQPDSEKIYADCSPSKSELFVKIKDLITDIQNELDKSWASLGEVYGFLPNNKPSIKFRRITSNLDNKVYLKKLNYVPKRINFEVDNNLSKLLVAPLYGDNPTFGVRELLQNSIDSCIERKYIENQKNNFTFNPEIKVSIKRVKEDLSVFNISDNGKGMNDYEIINYFLNVGTSFRKSMDWKKRFIDEEGKSKISRTGKFGIGVLASFLLGEEIKVNSKSMSDEKTYSFTANIDSQYINISKETNRSDFGVDISISINDKKRNELLTNYSSQLWTDWYIYDEPKISFIVDDEILAINNKYSLDKFYDFETEEFEKISWSYINDSSFYYSSMIACNGIIITENYEPNEFLKKHYEIIRKKPAVLVTDKEGIFPVKLDRNDIDCDEFPFEEELLIEVSKHFIAKLLTIEIDLTNLNKTKLIHSPKFIYGKEGFLIDCNYFLNGIKDKTTFIRLMTNKSNVEIDFEKFEKCFFTIEFNKYFGLKSQSNNIAPSGGARIIMPKANYVPLFDTNTRYINKYLKASSIIEEESNEHILYRIDGYNKQPSILDKIINIDKNLLSNCISIQEITHSFFNNINCGKVLGDLLEKYIKNNYIIPYDISLRRKLYKEAFEDLEKFF